MVTYLLLVTLINTNIEYVAWHTMITYSIVSNKFYFTIKDVHHIYLCDYFTECHKFSIYPFILEYYYISLYIVIAI